MVPYYAKSVLSNGSQPTVREHMGDVAKYAADYGQEIGAAEAARIAGLFHDFGKYSKTFQEGVLHGIASADHAVCGAAFLYLYVRSKPSYFPVLEVISAHHTSLIEYGMLEQFFKSILKSSNRITAPSGKESALTKEEFQGAVKQFKTDFPGFHTFPRLELPYAQDAGNLESMLFTRMLFSCLVDSDYSVSIREEHPDYMETSEQIDFQPEKLLEKLYEKRDAIRRRAGRNCQAVNQIRDELFERCGTMGDLPAGLFTLTAPTGTGKTLALLHFALRHCLATGKRRIILVLPFLTLAEQNAAVYKEIVPNILVDHSQQDLSDEEREFSARWRVPFILTTSVKFFESLFSSKPADCRKLHSIANSVIIFDEAQSLPPELTTATLRAVNELCRTYHCSMVFSTATQPDFAALPGLHWNPTEMNPDNPKMYQALRRTNLTWLLDQPTSFDRIAEEMSKENSVCTIVNLRRHAAALFRKLKDRCPADTVFFLTTDLCMSHRRRIVRQINDRLNSGQPCRVVATQCIEAGVDFDFDVLYRALAPLDSIIQAAGRCNRNGRLTDGGSVWIFEPEDDGRLYPSDFYEAAAMTVKTLSLRHPIDIHDPSQIQEYYQELFRDAKDKKALTEAILDRDFEKTGREYQMIGSRGAQVIVPYQKESVLFQSICKMARTNGVTPKLLHEAAGILVTVHRSDALEQFAEPLYFPRKHGEQKEAGIYVLRSQYESCYTDGMGLQLPEREPACGFFW